ncbi:uncharacterized protein LOC144750152 [Ciona intestinalis]
MTFWGKGMRRPTSNLVSDASAISGLSIPKVKRWIQNHKSKLTCTTSKKSRILLSRKQTAYNLFCSSLQDVDFRLWGKAWAGLSETEKENWKDKVDQQPCNEEMDDKQRNSLITKQLKIMTQVTETLDKAGVVMYRRNIPLLAMYSK